MKQKRTNIKIKHTKHNLYHKTSKTKQHVLSVLLTIAIAAVLGIVGYGIGKPLMNFLSQKEDITSSDSSAWTPPVKEESSAPEDSGSDASSAPEEDDPPEESSSFTGMYFLPAGAAKSTETLNSAIAAAKSSGCTGVVVTLKDDTGAFLYKTAIEEFKDAESVTGSLTAAQICRVITNAGLTPAARISTLKDAQSSVYVGGGYQIVGGGSWLDDAPAHGGKRWQNPFDSATASFIEAITAEISAAGFKYIIAADTRFPAFYQMDISTYLSNLPLTDSKKRSEALWSVVNAAAKGAEKNGAELVIEVDAADISAANKQSTTAELCGDKKKFSKVSLLVKYTADSDSTNAYATARSAAAAAAAAYGSGNFAVRISGSFSDTVLTDIKKAFVDAGAAVFTG